MACGATLEECRANLEDALDAWSALGLQLSHERLTAVSRLCYKRDEERSGAMSKTAVIRARVEPELKEQAETIFERLGVSTTQAIAMFYKQVILRRGLPFDVAIPNATTRRTFEATDAGRDVVLCRDADDMFKKLRI